MAQIHDFTINPPEKKTDLNKESMLKYVSGLKAADKKWFVELMNSNKENKRNNLTDEVVEGYNMSKIREAFAQKYFPEISSKAKKASKSRYIRSGGFGLL